MLVESKPTASKILVIMLLDLVNRYPGDPEEVTDDERCVWGVSEDTRGHGFSGVSEVTTTLTPPQDLT